MKNKLYVVYDNIGLRYGQVSAYPSDGFALITMRPLIAGQDPVQSKVNLQRYELCCVGELDVETGHVVPQDPVRLSWSSTPYLETVAEEEKTTLPLGQK